MIRVVVIEDNTILRQTLEQLFNRSQGMVCTGTAGNLHNIVSDLRKATPDIILMDIGLPDINGIEGVRTVKQNFQNIQVLMFTVFEDDEKIFDAIRSGASGYLLKKTPPEQILEAVQQLYEGGAPMSPSIARKVIQAFQSPAPATMEQYQLTAREKDILNAFVDGLSYKKIGEKYFVSIHTVRSHICNIYEKLHVNSKSQAVAKVLQQK